MYSSKVVAALLRQTSISGVTVMTGAIRSMTVIGSRVCLSACDSVKV